MVKLMVALVDELKSRGFEIGHTDVSEDELEILTFQNGDNDYSVGIELINGEQGEYLGLTGSVTKGKWWDTGFMIEPLLKELKSPNDGINIKRTEDGDVLVALTQFFDTDFSMKNVDKDATRAIAKDILGFIINY